MLILCIADLHIPHRVPDLPQQFKELLKPGKIHSILCAGNLCSKTVLEYLRTISSDVTLVQGDFDEFTSQEFTVVHRGDFKIGVIHGHQIVPAGDPGMLSLLHRQMGVDILITANTHEHKIVKCEEGLQITLGSATGAQPTHTLPQKAAAASSSGGTSGGGAPQATGGAQPPGTKTCTPSFVLLDIDNSRATVYVYQLLAGKVKVDRVDLSLPPKPAAAG